MSNNDIITSGKEFAGFASELTDEEIKRALQVIMSVRRNYQHKAFTVENLDALRDETITRLAEISILASVDVAPCLNGEPPVVEIVGKVSTDPIHKHGFDHERKYYEVNKANERGEDYLGQTSDADATKAKKRNRAG